MASLVYIKPCGSAPFNIHTSPCSPPISFLLNSISNPAHSPQTKDMTDAADCTEVLEDDSKSILLALIGQLRMGMDLHRVTLPTFVLEPRSMLERISDFMVHPDLLMRSGFYRIGGRGFGWGGVGWRWGKWLGGNAHVTSVRLGSVGLGWDLVLVPSSVPVLANAVKMAQRVVRSESVILVIVATC